MKTAPDLMDEKNSNTTNRSCWFSYWENHFHN
jgi:hypothetical protein